MKKSNTNAPRVIIAKIYLSINNSVKSLIYKDTSDVAKTVAEFAQKKEQQLAKCNKWPMVSFIHNRSEITTRMRHSFKTKSTNSKATFLR